MRTQRECMHVMESAQSHLREFVLQTVDTILATWRIQMCTATRYYIMRSLAADADGRHCHSEWLLQAGEAAVGVIIFVINLGLLLFFAGVLVCAAGRAWPR